MPRADRQQNEYLPASEERLAWLTGFTGSAGAAIVLGRPRRAVRRRPLHGAGGSAGRQRRFSPSQHLVENPPDQWLEQNLKSGTKIGYDPWLHTATDVETLSKACAAAGATLVPVDSNPIDALWTDRPAPPAGRRGAARRQIRRRKRRRKAQARARELARLRADALVVSDPQNVAWAFNIRGADVAHTPLALAFALVPRDGRPALYVDGGKLDNDGAPCA